MLVVAIAGRPNVGKSTLFNRLTRTKSALVSDLPGLTRDRQYGKTIIEDKNLLIVDTGGIGEAETPVEALMENQTKLALAEAQLILFLVDVKAGLTTADSILANKLRKLNKSVLLVVNKIDISNSQGAILDFYSLGFGNPLEISAEHNLGFEELKNAIITKLPREINIPLPKAADNAIKVAFIGRPNVGKSTLINRILGEERVVVYDEPGTTRDSIFINFDRNKQNYVLIDTAGIRRRGKIVDKIEKFSVIKTLGSIEIANVVVFILDATENITDQDLKLLGLVIEAGKALVIAVNKWDNLAENKRYQIKSELDRRLVFIDYAKIYFISALHGTGVGKLFSAINQSYISATKELKTSEINKILEEAVANFQPPLAYGREIKLRYAHVGGHNPPTIIIHGTRIEYLPNSYRRYLEKFFRKSLKLSGTPIKVLFNLQ